MAPGCFMSWLNGTLQFKLKGLMPCVTLRSMFLATGILDRFGNLYSLQHEPAELGKSWGSLEYAGQFLSQELFISRISIFRFDMPVQEVNDRGSSTICPYYNVNAWVAGSKVGVKYVSFQCEHFLTKAESLEYLQWLDSGRVGKHFSVLKRK